MYPKTPFVQMRFGSGTPRHCFAHVPAHVLGAGVTIAKEVELEDPVENIGAKLVRQVQGVQHSAGGKQHSVGGVHISNFTPFQHMQQSSARMCSVTGCSRSFHAADTMRVACNII